MDLSPFKVEVNAKGQKVLGKDGERLYFYCEDTRYMVLFEWIIAERNRLLAILQKLLPKNSKQKPKFPLGQEEEGCPQDRRMVVFLCRCACSFGRVFGFQSMHKKGVKIATEVEGRDHPLEYPTEKLTPTLVIMLKNKLRQDAGEPGVEIYDGVPRVHVES